MCKVLSTLREYRKWSQKRPPAAALGLILDHLGILPLAATRANGETRAGNLLKALEIGLWDSEKIGHAFPELVERLATYVEGPDVESMSLEPGKKRAVRIMNLHKAKGLESPVVFLADPLKEISHPPDRHIDRTGDRARGFFVASRKKGDYGSEVLGLPPGWIELETREARYREAEETRLLYVAATRARQLLVVSQYPDKPDKGAWKDFGVHLIDVPELEEGDGERTSVPLERRSQGEGFAEAQERRIERFSQAAEPSYLTEAVTDATREPAVRPAGAGKGKGMAWGRIIHRLLELQVRLGAFDVKAVAGRLLEEDGMPISSAKDAAAWIDRVLQSDLWQRMEKAGTVLAEVPFSITRHEETPPRTIVGVVDAAFREEDGWVLVDYKTDAVDEEGLETLAAHYRPQIETYRACWEESTGEAVKETGLYFVGPGEWVAM
ncbi:MAG: 3'-5' exonuclease [Gemmatimonadota bacterium]